MCCVCFSYNTKDASSTEWLQPTGDEANKRVSRSQAGPSRRTPGYIYIIVMDDCLDQSAPPFAKVGYTNDCDRRIAELQQGNPHELLCKYNFWVNNRHDAERAAHRALDAEDLRVNCGGGSEWFKVEDDLDDIDDFAEIVRAAIHEYMQEEEEEESEEEYDGNRDLAESSINLAPNQSAAKMATNYGHNNTKWRQDLKGNMLHVKYNCK